MNENFYWLHNKLKDINNHGNFNCLISEGEYLFCYYDKNGYNGLCFVQRIAPFGTVHLLDEDFEINLAEEKEPSQRGFIIATKRLTDERWENFHPGELIVFRNGDMVFSSTGRSTNRFSTPLNEAGLEILRVLRESPHRLNLRTICDKIASSHTGSLPLIRSLLCKGYIKQASSDRVKWDHNDATFYTEPSKRAEIDKLIRK